MSLKNTIRYDLFSATSVHLTHEASIHSAEVVGSQHVNWGDVIDQLERMSAEFCPRKEANVLINGGNCDISTEDGKVKGKANFSSINGIWLDIDDGELTPHELANVILPQFRLLIFNSFNNGVYGKLKYRVLIPTSRPMPSAAFEMVWEVLKEMIESFGYFVGFRDA